MVLLKGHGPDGFVFYTNLDSRKGEDLAVNPHARLAVPLEVAAPPGPRSKARSRRSADAEADVYFASRSREFAARRLGVGPVAAAARAARSSKRGSTTCA